MADHWHDDLDPSPVPLPDGGELVTLRDAGDYIARLSKREQSKPEWRLARPKTCCARPRVAGLGALSRGSRLCTRSMAKPSRRSAIQMMRRRRRSGEAERSETHGDDRSRYQMPAL
jgi:hypothetical protein